MENRKLRVAITHGDTNGIGYELIFKTFADPEMLELCIPIVYGSPKIAAYHRKALDINAQFSIIQNANDAKEGRVNLLATFDDEVKVDLGEPTPESGDAAMRALDRAMTDYRDGLFDVLVTAPINRSNISMEGFDFQGNSKFIETCVGEGRKSFDVLVNENMRIAFLSTRRTLRKRCRNLRALFAVTSTSQILASQLWHSTQPLTKMEVSVLRKMRLFSLQWRHSLIRVSRPLDLMQPTTSLARDGLSSLMASLPCITTRAWLLSRPFSDHHYRRDTTL